MTNRFGADRFALVLCLSVLGLVTSCGGGGSRGTPPPGGNLPVPQPEFRLDGLSGLTILGIYQHGDRLFAATDDGLFAKALGQDSWQIVGLDSFQIQALSILSDQHMLAAVVLRPDRDVFQDPELYETVNGGANWLPVDSDFGGGFGENIGIWALHHDVADGRLYATGQDALAVSADTGRSWQLLAGAWDGLSPPQGALNLNAAKGQVWFGGQNAIEQLKLRRHDLESGETTEFDVFLLPSPATIEGITLDPSNPDRILASGEGGILQSLDNGETWAQLLGQASSRFYFETALDPQDSQVIYSASWRKEFDLPQTLILEVSSDGGESWTAYELNDPDLFGGAWSIRAVVEDGRTVLYIGLFRGGIMKVLLPA